MFKFLKTDPSKKAKKYVDKAMIEIEEGYPQYASIEFEKAARIFFDEGQVDFAIKYFREAAYTALESNDHTRCAEMKIAAAESLFSDGRYDEGGGLYSESSDHLFRDKKAKNSIRSLGVAIIAYLGARNTDTAINLTRKGDKRYDESSAKTDSMYELARLCSSILCEGQDVEKDIFDKLARSVKPTPREQELVDFVVNSVRLALQTEVALSWAGKKQDVVPVKSPIELELQFKCPVDVKMVNQRVNLSNSVVIKRTPDFSSSPSKGESWLIEFVPVISGTGVIGPYTVTLEGEKVLVHKHTNTIEFTIAPAPPNLELNITPERVSCTLGDEVILEVNLKNNGDGPASNISVKTALSEGLEISLGNEEKTINFLGSGESIHFQLFVRAISQGEEILTINLKEGQTGQEIAKTSMVRVG